MSEMQKALPDRFRQEALMQGNPYNNAQDVAAIIMKMLNSVQVPTMGPLTCALLCVFHSEVQRAREMRKWEGPIELEQWVLPRNERDALEDYLRLDTLQRNEANFGYFPPPETQIRNIIYDLLIMEHVEDDLLGIGVELSRNVTVPLDRDTSVLGYLSGRIEPTCTQSDFTEDDYDMFRYDMPAAGRGFHLSTGRCSTRLAYMHDARDLHRGPSSGAAIHTLSRAPTAPETSLMANVEINDRHGDGYLPMAALYNGRDERRREERQRKSWNTPLLTRYSTDSSYFKEFISWLIARGLFPIENSADGRNITGNSSNRAWEHYQPNEDALRAMNEATQEYRLRLRERPLIEDPPEGYEDLDEFMQSDHYRDLVELYGVESSDSWLMVHDERQQKIDEIIQSHRRTWRDTRPARKRTTATTTKRNREERPDEDKPPGRSYRDRRDRSTSEDEPSEEDDNRSRSIADSTQTSNQTRGSYQDKWNAEAENRQRVIQKKPRQRQQLSTVNEDAPALASSQALVTRDQRREEAYERSERSSNRSSRPQGSSSFEDTRTVARSRTESSEGSEEEWATTRTSRTSQRGLRTGDFDSEFEEENNPRKPFKPRISDERKQYLEDLVRNEEGEVDYEGRARQIEGLGDLYIHRPYDRSYDVSLIRQKPARWDHTDAGSTTIGELLIRHRSGWENNNSPAASVLKELYEGDQILADQSLEMWQGVREAGQWTMYRATRFRNREEPFTKPEIRYMESVLVQVYLERYCQLFYEEVDAQVMILRMRQLVLEQKGRLQGIQELYTSFLKHWRKLPEASRKLENISLLFKNCILNSGTGRDDDGRTDSGIKLWDQVEKVIRELQGTNPNLSKDQALTGAVKKIGQTYKSTNALRALATPSSPTESSHRRENKKDKPRERNRDKSRQKAAVKSTKTRTYDSDSDGSTTGGKTDHPRQPTVDALHEQIAHLQTCYNDLSNTRAVQEKPTGGGPNRPPGGGGKPNRPPGGASTPCLDCGKLHVGQCYMMVNGKFDMAKLARMLKRQADPKAALDNTLKVDWPRATRQKFTVAQATELRRLMEDSRK